MKKFIVICLALVLTFSGAVMFSSCKNTEGNYKIGIIQYVSHPSLDNCYEGIVKALEVSDIAGKYTIDRQIGSDASADADCETYAKSMVAQKYDMIFAIATPAAMSAFAATENTKIPVIFCAVSDPVKAELVASLENPGDLCTGTSDVLDFDAQLNLIKALQPDVKKIGVLYTSSEANSISQLATFTDAAAKMDITVVPKSIQNDADIPSAAAELASGVDCINNFTDNKVVNNLSVLLTKAKDAGIPVYGSEVEQVKNGCLASVSIDYVALGKVTGEMGVSVLGGADIKTMAVKTISDATPVINKQALTELGITLPEAYSNAEFVNAD